MIELGAVSVPCRGRVQRTQYLIPSTQYLVPSTRYSIRNANFRILLLAAAVASVLLDAATAQQSAPNLTAGTRLAPKAFRAAAAKVQPSIVKIEGFGGVAAGADVGGYQAPGDGPTTGLII